MRQLARRAFVAGTWLVLASVLLQLLLAGLGVFADAGFFFWHASVNAAVVGGLPFLLILAGWIGRAPGHLLRLAASVPGLTALQSLLLVPYHMNAQGPMRAVSGLHVLNAILIFWVALRLAEGAHDWSAVRAAGDVAEKVDAGSGVVIEGSPKER
jgi:hypothetical protein